MHKLYLTFKDRMLKVYTPSDQTRISVGRDPACDIHIDNLAIEPQHLNIQLNKQQVVVDLANKDIWIQVNHKKPESSEEIAINSGDEIQLGKYTLKYTWETDNQVQRPEPLEDDTVPASRQLNGWLQMMSGPKMGRTLALNKIAMRIGPHKSKVALITNRDDGYYISLIDKNFPVVVNNEILGSTSVALREGHTIQMGDTRMLFFTENP